MECQINIIHTNMSTHYTKVSLIIIIIIIIIKRNSLVVYIERIIITLTGYLHRIAFKNFFLLFFFMVNYRLGMHSGVVSCYFFKRSKNSCKIVNCEEQIERIKYWGVRGICGGVFNSKLYLILHRSRFLVKSLKFQCLIIPTINVKL